MRRGSVTATRWYRKILMITVCSILCIFLWGCGGESTNAADVGDVGEPTSGRWVVEIYFCGSDLESKAAAVTNDISEMLAAPPPENVTFVFQTGGTTQWNNNVMSPNEIGRYIYDKDGMRKLEALPDADMGNADTLSDFVRYAQDNFPADHRVLILWDHGGGTLFGACQDERTGSVMALNQIQDAIGRVYQKDTSNPPFDIIGFDACLMATYSTAGTFEGYGHYLVASQETEPGNGWYYTGIVKGFNDGVGSDPAVLGKVICDSYIEGCEQVGTAQMATLSMTDLTKMPRLRSAYESMGAEAVAACKQNPKQFFASYCRKAENTSNYGGNTKSAGYTNMIDLGEFADNTSDILPNTYNDVRAALDEAVVYHVGGLFMSSSTGLSCYYPYLADPSLQQKFDGVIAGAQNYKALYDYLVTGHMPEVPPLAFDIKALEDLPVNIDQGGYAYCQLNNQQMDNLSEVRCEFMYYDVAGDVLVAFGSDSNVNMDWQSGLCKDNFDGTWPMLCGHLIYIEVMNVNDNRVTYFVPIKLNGDETNMIVAYDYNKNEYQILGTRHEITDGLADRNLVKLKAGDTITTRHPVASIKSGGEDMVMVDGDTFQLPAGFSVQDSKVDDGKYAYMFEFVTPKGDTALSSLATYNVKDGTITTSTDVQ